jgi:hypothetical protein
MIICTEGKEAPKCIYMLKEKKVLADGTESCNINFKYL